MTASIDMEAMNALIKRIEGMGETTAAYPGTSVPFMPGYTIIGTCSRCRGPVQVPQVWSGVIPPVPQCGRCGAQKANNNYGPVIEMGEPWNPGTMY